MNEVKEAVAKTLIDSANVIKNYCDYFRDCKDGCIFFDMEAYNCCKFNQKIRPSMWDMDYILKKEK